MLHSLVFGIILGTTQQAPAQTPITGPVNVQFQQDTDAYFLVTTTRKVLNASADLRTKLADKGFILTGQNLTRTRQWGVVWKVSRDGYEAVPGPIPVVAKINFYQQRFQTGGQEVAGSLVRSDGSLVKQAIVNGQVYAGSEVIPVPWINPGGGYSWMAYDRPVYESVTTVLNTVQAPIAPIYPFTLPAKFTTDTRFSLLLYNFADERELQTLFRVKKLYKQGEDKFAEGTLASANDSGPQVSGTLTVNLSAGALQALDATVAYPDGKMGDVTLGKFTAQIQAKRVTSSSYQKTGLEVVTKAFATNESSTDFDTNEVVGLIQRGRLFSVEGTNAAVEIQPEGKAKLTEGSKVLSGTWALQKRRVVLRLGRGDKPAEFRFNLSKNSLTAIGDPKAVIAAIPVSRGPVLDTVPHMDIKVNGVQMEAWSVTSNLANVTAELKGSAQAPLECVLVTIPPIEKRTMSGAGMNYFFLTESGFVHSLYRGDVNNKDTYVVHPPEGVKYALGLTTDQVQKLGLQLGDIVKLDPIISNPSRPADFVDQLLRIDLMRYVYYTHLKDSTLNLSFKEDGSVKGEIRSGFGSKAVTKPVSGTWSLSQAQLTLSLTGAVTFNKTQPFRPNYSEFSVEVEGKDYRMGIQSTFGLTLYYPHIHKNK